MRFPYSPRVPIATILVAIVLGLALAPPLAAQEAPAPAALLVGPTELTALEDALMAAVEQNRNRRCPRPVLRGKPLDGPADEAMVAVVESDALKDCYDAVKEARDEVQAYLMADFGAKEPPAAVLTKCKGLPAALAKAVAHADACSPYLFGRRGSPSLLPVVRGANAAAILVRERAREGQWESSFQLATDALRFYQDLGRGPGASLIAAMVGTAAFEHVIDDGLRPALEAGVLPEKLQAMVLKELGLLMASEPRFCDFLAYERHGMPLQLLLPRLKGEGWTPPGGFDADLLDETGKPRPYVEEGKVMAGMTHDQEAALSWAAMDKIHARMEAACRSAATPVAQSLALRAVSEDAAARSRVPTWKRLVLLFFSEQPDVQLRTWIEDILQAIAAPAFEKYVLRYAERRFLLQALRLQVLVGPYARDNRVCPSLTMLDNPAYALARKDPNSGELLQVEVSSQGTIRIQPSPSFVAALPDSPEVPAYEFRCPTGR